MTETSREETAERAGELAAEYERTCTGCAQSVVAGLLDALEIESPDVFKAASGLADGIGLTGDGSCGALTGCAMVIGLVRGRERKDHRDMMKPMQSYLGDRHDRDEEWPDRFAEHGLTSRSLVDSSDEVRVQRAPRKAGHPTISPR